MSADEISEWVDLIKERLDEGEGAISAEFVVGKAEADKLHDDFDAARAAVDRLADLARSASDTGSKP